MKDLAKKSIQLPDDFECHSRLKRMHIAGRLKDIENGQVDWATAEIIGLVSLNL